MYISTLLLPAIICAAQQTPNPPIALTVSTFTESQKKIKDKVALADAIRRWYGVENLKNGGRPKEDNLAVVWAIEVTGIEKDSTPRVISQDGSFTQPLKRLGDTDVYTAVTTLAEGQAFRYAYEVNGAKKGDWRDIEVYTRPPELIRQPGVPEGTVTEMPVWTSKVFEGTTRHWWVYVPKQYTADKPANVLVVQDGNGSKNEMPVVLDNMIAKGDIPVTIAIFIEPGTKNRERDNRSFEYDTLSDAYARLLTDELLPEVQKTYNLRQDAAGRAISGTSSGGICAFTVAWEKPEAFRNVISGVGSFTNLQGGPTGVAGGNTYPAILRHSAGWGHEGKPKPIKIYMSDGKNDLDNAAGNWPLSNMQMDKALTYAGYDHVFVFGNGFHNGKLNMIQMPNALRWIWQDQKPAQK